MPHVCPSVKGLATGEVSCAMDEEEDNLLMRPLGTAGE